MKISRRRIGASLIVASAGVWAFAYFLGREVGSNIQFVLQLAVVCGVVLGWIPKQKLLVALLSGIGLLGLLQLYGQVSVAAFLVPSASDALQKVRLIALALSIGFGGAFAYTLIREIPFEAQRGKQTSVRQP